MHRRALSTAALVLAVHALDCGLAVAGESEARVPTVPGTPAAECERLSWEFAHPPPRQFPGPASRAMGFGATPLDSNGDGLVSADEAAARREAAFVSLDADGDGALSPAEQRAIVPSPGGRDRFRALDTNADDAVDRAEFMAGGKRHYEASDLDADGAVTVWEYRSRPRL